jgi:hypothetical protein
VRFLILMAVVWPLRVGGNGGAATRRDIEPLLVGDKRHQSLFLISRAPRIARAAASSRFGSPL